MKNGAVTLAGQVDSCSEKWNAERAAQRVAGVKAMSTELKVQLTSLSKRTDADIAEAVENVLEWTSSLPASDINVIGAHSIARLSTFKQRSRISCPSSRSGT